MNKEKKYALISSIFFLLAVLSDLIVRFTNSYGLRWTIPSSLSSITLILLWIFQVGLAIVVFIRHKKLVMAVAGINTILFVFNFFYSYNWGWVFAIIAYIAFIAVVFLALKENNIVNSIWFIPSITLLISFILVLVFRYLVSMGIFSLEGVSPAGFSTGDCTPE